MSSPPGIDQQLAEAMKAHQAGQLGFAESLYHKILAHDPDHPDALHFLGLLRFQRDDFESAKSLINRSIELAPNVPSFYSNLAAVLQRAGDVEGTIAACKKAVALQPTFFEAHNNLALALAKGRHFDEAAAAAERAASLRPLDPAPRLNLARIYLDAKRYDASLIAYRGILDLDSSYFHAVCGLCDAYTKLSRYDEALAACDRALLLSRDSPEIYGKLGFIREMQGKYEEAITHYRRAVELKPTFAEAMSNVGSCLLALDKIEESAEAYRQAMQINPRLTQTLNNLNIVYGIQKRFDKALETTDEMLRLLPQNADILGCKAAVLDCLDRHEEAFECCHQAIAINPRATIPLTNLGVILAARGQHTQALEYYARALDVDAEEPTTKWNRGLALLTLGQMPEGWVDSEVRFNVKSLRLRRPAFSQPQWRGEDLQGKTILVYGEQGIGDTINFIRYAALLHDRGANVILGTNVPLQKLMSSVPGVDSTILNSQEAAHFDYHASLMSLPAVLQTTQESIPKNVPYISVDPDHIALWRDRLHAKVPGRAVGIVWSGNPEHGNDKNRSLHLSDLAPLGLAAKAAGITLVSLQKGPRANEAASPPPGMPLVDFGPDLDTFYDTAALMMNLDLIVGVDTSVVHVAGALARPVWTLLPFVPDYRWMLHRPDSPWYPTMRLFRQPRLRDWQTTINEVAEALQKL